MVAPAGERQPYNGKYWAQWKPLLLDREGPKVSAVGNSLCKKKNRNDGCSWEHRTKSCLLALISEQLYQNRSPSKRNGCINFHGRLITIHANAPCILEWTRVRDQSTQTCLLSIQGARSEKIKSSGNLQTFHNGNSYVVRLKQCVLMSTRQTAHIFVH